MWTLNSGFGDNVYVQETSVHFLDNPELKMPLKIFTFSDMTNIYLLKYITIFLQDAKMQLMRVMSFVLSETRGLQKRYWN